MRLETDRRICKSELDLRCFDLRICFVVSDRFSLLSMFTVYLDKYADCSDLVWDIVRSNSEKTWH